MDKNLDMLNKNNGSTNHTNNKDEYNPKTSVCDSYRGCSCKKFMLGIAGATIILIASTYFFTRSYYQNELTKLKQIANSSVIVSYQDNLEQMNKDFNDDMKSLKQEMIEFKHSLFDELNNQILIPDFSFNKRFNHRAGFNQRSSIIAKEDQYLITVEVPGFTKEQIGIEFSANSIIIKADNNDKDNVKHFKHVMSLQNDVVIEGIKSTLKDGILTIIVPRIERNSTPINIE